jgi:hypothetical protein
MTGLDAFLPGMMIAVTRSSQVGLNFAAGDLCLVPRTSRDRDIINGETRDSTNIHLNE